MQSAKQKIKPSLNFSRGRGINLSEGDSFPFSPFRGLRGSE